MCKTDPTLAENFDDEFTNEVIKDTPVEGANLDSQMKDYFLNFSYVAKTDYLTKAFEKWNSVVHFLFMHKYTQPVFYNTASFPFFI